MALNKESNNYCYNVGRTVALVEIINRLPSTFASLVHTNAGQKLPYQLNAALRKVKHSLHGELIDPAAVVLNKGELPFKAMTAIDQSGSFWVGYYHEKAYLADEYNK